MFDRNGSKRDAQQVEPIAAPSDHDWPRRPIITDHQPSFETSGCGNVLIGGLQRGYVGVCGGVERGCDADSREDDAQDDANRALGAHPRAVCR